MDKVSLVDAQLYTDRQIFFLLARRTEGRVTSLQNALPSLAPSAQRSGPTIALKRVPRAKARIGPAHCRCICICAYVVCTCTPRPRPRHTRHHQTASIISVTHPISTSSLIVTLSNRRRTPTNARLPRFSPSRSVVWSRTSSLSCSSVSSTIPGNP